MGYESVQILWLTSTLKSSQILKSPSGFRTSMIGKAQSLPALKTRPKIPCYIISFNFFTIINSIWIGIFQDS